MNKTFHLKNKIQIDISLLPGLGFVVAYEHKYKELSMIMGCFLITIEFIKPRKRK